MTLFSQFSLKKTEPDKDSKTISNEKDKTRSSSAFGDLNAEDHEDGFVITPARNKSNSSTTANKAEANATANKHKTRSIRYKFKAETSTDIYKIDARANEAKSEVTRIKDKQRYV